METTLNAQTRPRPVLKPRQLAGYGQAHKTTGASSRPVLKPRQPEKVPNLLAQNVVVLRHDKTRQPQKLTIMQIEILKWISFGKKNQEISEIMGIKRNYVHQQTYRTQNILGAYTPAGAVGIALRRRIII